MTTQHTGNKWLFDDGRIVSVKNCLATKLADVRQPYSMTLGEYKANGALLSALIIVMSSA